jgi:HPt (histidine-containing phosphotransfer) domain-containing protein
MITDPTSQPLAINWDRLHQISDGDGEFEIELLQMLAEDLQEQMLSLTAAVADRDNAALKHLAHYLKGATANLGLTVMSGLALKLEGTAATEQYEEAAQLVTAFQNQQDRLLAYLAVGDGVPSIQDNRS